MTNTRAEAFAPASMGNVGVGFDILGLAFAEPGDTVIAEWGETPGAHLVDIQGDAGKLPREPKKNVATVAAQALLDQLRVERGVNLTLIKGLPLASGLGSSAASSVAAVVAVNALLGAPLTREELLPACLEGEALVSGYHADNAGPCLLGGITLITGTQVSDIRKLPVPDNLHFALVTPDIEVHTAEARAVLPETVTLKAMIAQTGHVAELVDSLYRGDLKAAAAAMEADRIIEPARAHLMPLLDEIRFVAKRAGAFGLVISGAGPTLCAICDNLATAQAVARTMKETYAADNISALSRVTNISIEGAAVLSVS